MRIARGLFVISAVIALAGCAPKKPLAPAVAVAPGPPPVDVTALVRHGCFRCLDRAAAAAQGDQAFEVAVLLVLRAKELGIPHAEYVARAKALAPADPGYAFYLQLADEMPVDPMAGERYTRGDAALASVTRGAPGAPARLGPVNDRFALWRDQLRTAPGSPLFRGYVQLLANCLSRPPGNTASPADDAMVPERSEAPLLRYRAGLCGRAEELKQLRDEDAEFVDLDYPLGSLALTRRTPELDEALQRATTASEAFPESLAILTLLGAVRTEREEFADALAAYERVLERMPVHRDALLGRTVALSHLGRYQDGLASATGMVDLGSWYLGEAHYWRAWNLFQLQRYADARVDADRAKSLMVNASVFVLSGLIEWNERRLPTADSELVEALKMDFGRCDAARYLGRVRTQRSMRPEAIAAFKQAIQCYDLSISARQKLITDVEAGTASPGTKARVATGHRRAIADATRDRDECVTNLTALETPAGRS